jgi:HK97 family phage prohead protease
MEIKDPKLAEQIAAWEAQNKRVRSGIERRYICEEVRIDFENKSPRITGYAAVFNQRTQLWPGFYEEVAPGAFAKSIQADDVRALINHDPNLLLGRTKAETLLLSEDAHGLKYKIIPPDTTYAKDLAVSLKRKDITQSSFGFNIVDHSERKDEKTGDRTITLKEVKLYDVSPVTFPAYPGTEAHVRMMVGEGEIAYLFEDSGQVIVLPAGAEVRQEAALSDEDLFKAFEETKGRAFGS